MQPHSTTGLKRHIFRAAAIAAVLVVAAGILRWSMTRDGGEPEPTKDSATPQDMVERAEQQTEQKDQSAEAAPPLSSNRWHKERVATISKEDVDALVRNLANFDDMHLAMTNSGGGVSFSSHNPVCVNEMLPNSFRVRRLWEIGPTHPEMLTRAMHTALRDALAQWPVAFKDELALYDRATRGVCKDKPTLHDKIRMQATVATYLLAEYGGPQALPWIYESYVQQKRWIDAIPVDKYRWIPQAPVPPPISLCAMHRLIAAYPSDDLSPQGQKARTDYVTWAGDHIPDPEIRQVVSASSPIDDSDPMTRLMDPKGRVLEDAKKMPLPVYPTRFKDGGWMQKYPEAPYLTKRSEDWFNRLKAVIVAVRSDAPDKE